MSNNKEQIDKRNISFWNTDSPLTSRRVSIILNSPKDSKKLADAVRALRHNEHSTIKLSKETKDRIDAEAEKLKSA
ncbi:MAG: hypothetical protein AAF348_02620 [Bacteroidota bacterium]